MAELLVSPSPFCTHDLAVNNSAQAAAKAGDWEERGSGAQEAGRTDAPPSACPAPPAAFRTCTRRAPPSRPDAAGAAAARPSAAMEELQRKMSQRYEDTKPRKVRFKLASSYSGRVLKHVYEDGQELDSPEEQYPHSFVRRKLPPSQLETEQLSGFQDAPEDRQGVYPPTGLIAQRIHVYRGMGGCRPAAGAMEESEGDAKSSVLDFGKIIIYTSNLRIIRAPQRKPEASRHHTLPPLDLEGLAKAREKGSRRKAKGPSAQEREEEEEEEQPISHTQAEGGVHIRQPPLRLRAAATLFVLHSSLRLPPIVFILSVSCERILMSPRFHSAAAASAC
ncbi:glutaredoxin domain-containing cysteine-rich protein 2 isoform X2 [Betta splendens]|uniref:Glutaredoxin domain-containing cysteine-rich protein 2 isoform X2 n=1 Tax=Betta splendens TaxID=158456 RepID=A0A6P7PU19_BETSP|nr:glutaredoxin domain-containing cysteine-rich protein 2 isoform X2 [Betta splendens]